MKKISIGIDFSKESFDATVMFRDEDRFFEAGYCKFDNDLKGYRAFLKWVSLTVKPLPDSRIKSEWLFCGEHTGTCSIGLCDFLAKKKLFMWLESALVIHRKSGIVREKNDKVDSKRIAEYALRNFDDKVKPYELDSKDMKKLRSLYAAHNMLTKDKVAITNRIKSGTLDESPVAMRSMERQLKCIEKEIEHVDMDLKGLVSKSEEFKHNYETLNSFKGIGFITITCLIIKTRNFKDMTDARELGCYAGVVPLKQQSGTSIDKSPKTSRYRDRDTNGKLSNCAASAIVFNVVIKAYYERLLERGVPHYKAKNNCKFKIINILLAMIRNDKPFDLEIYGKSKKEWSRETA